jgi:hypothetical protein
MFITKPVSIGTCAFRLAAGTTTASGEALIATIKVAIGTSLAIDDTRSNNGPQG